MVEESSQADQNDELPNVMIAACVTCGTNTDNWCDICEMKGKTFMTVWGEALGGSPLCRACEDMVNQGLRVCQVCEASE